MGVFLLPKGRDEEGDGCSRKRWRRLRGRGGDAGKKEGKKNKKKRKKKNENKKKRKKKKTKEANK